MRLFVKSLESTLAVEAAAQDTVGALKAAVEAREGIPAEDQRLVYAGVSLEDDALVADVAEEDATLHLTLSLLGGAKKRKKKVYTKPKKIPHKHKKVKLAVLKFYKVDGQDRVQRLRKECPHENCGPGVFMATHFNRYHCGKCSLTYVSQKDGKA